MSFGEGVEDQGKYEWKELTSTAKRRRGKSRLHQIDLLLDAWSIRRSSTERCSKGVVASTSPESRSCFLPALLLLARIDELEGASGAEPRERDNGSSVELILVAADLLVPKSTSKMARPSLCHGLHDEPKCCSDGGVKATKSGELEEADSMLVFQQEHHVTPALLSKLLKIKAIRSNGIQKVGL